MLTLQEMKKAADALSPQERAELRDYLDQQPKPVSDKPIQDAPDSAVIEKARATFVSAPAPQVQAGTTDIDALFDGLKAMTSDLSDEEVDELVDTINQRSPSRQIDVG